MQTIEYICNIDMDLLPYNPRFIKLVLAKKTQVSSIINVHHHYTISKE